MQPLHRHLHSTATYVATADNPAAGVLAGDVLINTALKKDSLAWNLGLFCGADLELGFNRLFVKSAIEYNYYYYATNIESDFIASKVNLSGARSDYYGWPEVLRRPQLKILLSPPLEKGGSGWSRRLGCAPSKPIQVNRMSTSPGSYRSCRPCVCI